MTAVPTTASPLLCLPDELLQTITEALLPANVDREKPSDAIRFGATWRRLHALVYPIAFRGFTFVAPEENTQRGSIVGRGLPWLADYLFQHGHLVKTLSFPLIKCAPIHARSICLCVDRCIAYRHVVLSVLGIGDSRRTHDTGPLGWLFQILERRGPYRLESLVIDGAEHLGTNIAGFAALIANSSNLRDLVVLGESKAASAPFEHVIRAIQSCRQLETFKGGTVKGMELFIDATLPVPKLKTLDLTIAKPVASRLRHFLAVFATHLHVLKVTFVDDLQDDLPAPPIYLPVLDELRLYGANSIRVLQRMIAPDTPLVKLSFDGRDPAAPAIFETFYRSQPHKTITSCALFCGGDVADDEAQVIANLRRLDNFRCRVMQGT